MHAKLSVLDIVEHARSCRRSAPGDAVRAEVERYRELFDAAHAPHARTQFNIFSSHITVPASHRVINYVDVHHDHWQFNHRKLASHLAWSTSKFNPRARSVCA